MLEALQLLNSSLHNNGQSITKVRKAIFLQLLDKEPQTMHELVAALPTVDRSSIYRTVELFIKLRIIEKIQMGWKYKLELTDEFGHHHHHMTCLKCGSTVPIEGDPEIENSLLDLTSRANFKMTGHTLEINGYCQKCLSNLSST